MIYCYPYTLIFSKMHFKNLRISEWQQFYKVDINFDSKVTIITGANGSGKTTLLGNILARHCNWNLKSCSTPQKNNKLDIGRNNTVYNIPIGELTYSDNMECTIKIPNIDSIQYNLELDNTKEIKCFYVSAHRPIFRYQTLTNIQLQKKDKLMAFQEIADANKKIMTGSNSNSVSYIIKSLLINWAYQGNKLINNENIVINNPDAKYNKFFEDFNKILKKLLPQNLKFERLEIRDVEVLLICNNGESEFILEQASGGVSSIIDLAWQIYMFSTDDNNKFTVIIDEIENHLHPSLQREILPNLTEAFPLARFIVSTHSPLVIGSVKNSSVYALIYNEKQKVISKKLDLKNKAQNASEILIEALGVPFTMPIWMEENFKEITKKFSEHDIFDFDTLRNELSKIGLEHLLPLTLKEIINNKNNAKN